MSNFKKKLIKLYLDWQRFLKAYSVFFQKYLLKLLTLVSFFKSTTTSLLYRQRGRFAQPVTHFLLGLILFLGISFSSALEEKIRGQQMNWETGEGEAVAYMSEEEFNAATQVSGGMRGEIVEYVVKRGDTVSSIAKKFGISVDTIIWANNLRSAKSIKVGQRLKIPPVTGVVHKVRRGETVYSIAKKYSVSPQEIVDYPFNTFANDETFALQIGQILFVPNGVMPKAGPRVPRPAASLVAQGTGRGLFIWPTSGRITQRFSWYHRAVDIANRSAPDVVAAASGRVVLAIRSKWGYGRHVVIDHGNGYKTLYAHLNRIYVQKGQVVAQGQAIGQMGSTGRSTGTHLHFEIIKNGTKLNPLALLK